jgi:hypothetical protein
VDLEGKWQAILIGGLITGLGPFIPFLNLLCCVFPLIGGFVAVALWRNSAMPGFVRNQDGIVLGAFSGVAGAVIHAIVLIPLVYFITRFVGSLGIDILPALSDLHPVARSVLERIFSNLGNFVGIILLVRVLGHLVLSLAFGIIGGLLGVAVYTRKSQ